MEAVLQRRMKMDALIMEKVDRFKKALKAEEEAHKYLKSTFS